MRSSVRREEFRLEDRLRDICPHLELWFVGFEHKEPSTHPFLAARKPETNVIVILSIFLRVCLFSATFHLSCFLRVDRMARLVWTECA